MAIGMVLAILCSVFTGAANVIANFSKVFSLNFDIKGFQNVVIRNNQSIIELKDMYYFKIIVKVK